MKWSVTVRSIRTDGDSVAYDVTTENFESPHIRVGAEGDLIGGDDNGNLWGVASGRWERFWATTKLDEEETP